MRNDFPFLQQTVHGQPIAYFDNAATTQKPQVVLDALMEFYTTCNANVHRGIYTHAECATERYEGARATLASFIGVHHSEIIFTRGATEGINLVANAWAMHHLKPQDEIVITQLEHHANLLPWWQVARNTGALLKIIPVEADGTINLERFLDAITVRTKLVSVVHTSHVTGTHLPVGLIANRAHEVGARVLVDAAQSIVHQQVDVQSLAVDFLVFSGHKMVGPTGIGVLYIARALHDQMMPYQWGGGMVKEVRLSFVDTQEMPHRLEAGTPAIAQAIGLSVAADYLRKFDIDAMQEHEAALCTHFIKAAILMPRIHLVGSISSRMIIDGFKISN